MIKKNFKRTLAAALTGVMLMGTLAGCGGSGDNGNTSADNNAASTDNNGASTESSAPAADDGAATTGETTAETDASGATGIDSWEAFAENVTLKIPV